MAFRVGDVFPADDAVARWLTVVQMQLNDSVFTNTRLIEGFTDGAPDWQNAYFARLAAANVFEAAAFLRDSSRRFPEVARFVETLSDDAQRSYDEVVACADGDTDLRKTLARMRHTVSHYPELLAQAPDYEDLRRALLAHADSTGEIILGRRLADFRSLYADDVAVEIAVPGDGITVQFVEMLRDAVVALNDFCTEALVTYFAAYPDSFELLPFDRDAPE